MGLLCGGPKYDAHAEPAGAGFGQGTEKKWTGLIDDIIHKKSASGSFLPGTFVLLNFLAERSPS